MDYCDCGRQAVGRCTADGDAVCADHLRHYSVAIGMLLTTTGQEPPPDFADGRRGSTKKILCPRCYTAVIKAEVPGIADRLPALYGDSIEKVVLFLVRSCFWDDYEINGIGHESYNNRHPVGPDIVEAIAGRRPDWLFDDAQKMLAALYASVAAQRSIEPPRIEVTVEDVQTVRARLTGREKRISSTVRVGTIRAWTFSYNSSGEYGGRDSYLVGVRGAAVSSPHNGLVPGKNSFWGTSEKFDPGRVNRQADEVRQKLDSLNRVLDGAPQSHYVSKDVRETLLNAVESLLG